MEPKLMRYIWHFSARQQITLIIMTVLSFPILYMSLELPKIIVNEAIDNHAIPKSFMGYDFGPVEYVIALCVIYLLLLIGNGIFKMRINTFKGIVGERMLRRLRFTLIDRGLRFPIPHYSKVSPGEVISTVTAETEPLAGFIGDSFALPAMQGGTMLTILLFMFMQDPLLGLASVSMIPLQVYIIPKLQRKINILKKERVQRVRKLSERLNEGVANAQEIRVQGTHRYHMAEFSTHLGGIFWVRLQIYEAKFFMKFLNNLINQLTPILFLSIGGVLVIQGNITIGVILAALTAYKDMTAPWKELLNYYQNWADSLIKYEQIREAFEPEGLVEYNKIAVEPDMIEKLDGDLTVTDLVATNESGDKVLNNINLDVKRGQIVVIDGRDSPSLKRLAHTLRGLAPFDSGTITYGTVGQGPLPLQAVPHVVLGRRVALTGPEPTLFSGSIMQNIHYGLRHAPRPDTDETLTPERAKEIEEAERSGNMAERTDEIWTDFTQVGVEGFIEMREWFDECVKNVGSDNILFRNGIMGSYTTVGREQFPWDAFVRTRKTLKDIMVDRELEDLIHPLDPALYNDGMTVKENIFFGTIKAPECSPYTLGHSEEFMAHLDAHNLRDDMLTAGMALARQFQALIGDIAADDPVLDQFALLEKDTLETAIALRDRQAERQSQDMAEGDKVLLLQLCLAIIPDKHGKDLISPELEARLLKLRKDLQQNPMEITESYIHQFDAKEYHEDLTILENVCFGRLKDLTTSQMEDLLKAAEDALNANEARSYVMVLFGFNEVGIGGTRVPVIARQRIQMTRALIKKPDFMLLQEPLSVFTPEDRAEIIMNIRKSLPETTIIWMDQNIPEHFACDQRFTLKDGMLLGHEDDETHDESEEGSSGENALRKVIKMLEESALYSLLSNADRRRIAARGEFLSLSPGQYLYKAGSEPQNIYIVLEGSMSYVRQVDWSDEKEMTAFDVGDTVGIPELVSGVPRYASAKVPKTNEVDCKLLRVDGDLFMEVMENNSAMSFKVISMIGKRMYQMLRRA